MRPLALPPDNLWALRMRAWSPANSNSTSVFGSRPSRLRISCGIVTCPLDVYKRQQFALLLQRVANSA